MFLAKSTNQVMSYLPWQLTLDFSSMTNTITEEMLKNAFPFDDFRNHLIVNFLSK